MLVGLALAIAALGVPAAAANVVATVFYLWTLAVLAVVDGLRDGAAPLLVQLAIWDFSNGPTVRGFYLPGVLVMLTISAVIGALAAWRAARRGDNRVGVATSGTAGPLLVAAAYLLAAPQLAGESAIDPTQWSAYLFAPYAVLAGLAGSVLVAAIGPVNGAEETEKQADVEHAPTAADLDEPAAARGNRDAARRTLRRGWRRPDPAERAYVSDTGDAPSRRAPSAAADEPAEAAPDNRPAAVGPATVGSPLWPDRPGDEPTGDPGRRRHADG